MNTRFLIVLLLGFSSGVPYSLVAGLLQAWFASEGVSLVFTGLLSLVGLPYLYRVLFSPLLDRYSLSSLGKRRSWMLLTQILLFLGFHGMAFFKPSSHSVSLFIFAFLFSFIAALQDAVIDAHRIEWLTPDEYAFGASVAVVGYRFALVLAGGISLIVANHFGFAFMYHCMAFLMLPGIITVILSREPLHPITRSNAFSSISKAFRDMKMRLNLPLLFLFIFFYKLGSAFTATNSGIVMPFLIQGMGFSLEIVAYFNKIFGLVAMIVGGLLAGFLLFKWSLYRALMIFGLFQALANSLFVLLSVSGREVSLLAVSVMLDNFASGMAGIGLVTLFMQMVNRAYTATQFSIFIAISLVPSIFSGPFVAWLEPQIGWTYFYQVTCILSLFFIPFLLRMKPDLLIDETLTSSRGV